MRERIPDMICFSSIELSDLTVNSNCVKANVTLNKIDNTPSSFQLLLKYDGEIDASTLPLLRLAFTMPLLNYGLFTKQIHLRFPLCKSDYHLLKKLNTVFSKDIFVNKIIRRRTNYILETYLPNEQRINPKDANPKAIITSLENSLDTTLVKKMDNNRCGILSSGGKESLLTYGLLKEIGCKIYPFYVNESGGHWRTALPAFRYHKEIDDNTQKVWTNIDRFYVFMLDNLRFIRRDHRKIWADTYPIRLCIFPFYVFLLLPLFIKNNIGNLLIGSEFDDLRSKPYYQGIRHYYGIYDQHQDFDHLMNQWYQKRIPGLTQWSAVRNITGLIVERILVQRYSKLARYQRSCHSCHFEQQDIIPCGKCSKCMGVMLFLMANNLDPRIMKFRETDIHQFSEKIKPELLRLDEDEKNHSFHLLQKHQNKSYKSAFKYIDHVEKIHVNIETCDPNFIPDQIRDDILSIIQQYTNGYCELKNESWITIKKPKLS